MSTTRPHRFLVIGSNSFSGSHFVRYLLEQGDDVLGVSRSGELHPVFLPYRWDGVSTARFAFRSIDLNHDLEQLLELVREWRPDYVVNFAAQGMVAQSWLIPEHWYQTNVVAQVRLHDGLRKIDGIRKYVHVTTPEVYGSTDGWIKEHTHFAPSTPYAVSRAACDLHLLSFHRAYGFPVVFTRAANVYGPGQQLYRIVPRALYFTRTGQRLQLHGGGHSIRSFIHIRDVADATRRIALEGEPGTAYHVSTWQKTTIRELVEKICLMAGIAFTDLVDVSDDRLGKDQAYLLDSSRLRDTLGWSDAIGLEEGVRDTLQWVDTNLRELETQPHDYQHKA
ncbi:MAG: GDP-mannose 4,6-dehydratase [Gammaproteobacteria bacterium]